VKMKSSLQMQVRGAMVQQERQQVIQR